MKARSLSQVIEIGKSFQRSVRLEKDTERDGAESGYILTQTARETLRKVVDSLDDSSTERAWTLTGPYGVGKSAFAVYLARLFCLSGAPSKHAFNQLREIEPRLAEKLSGFGVKPTKRFLPVLTTARRAPAIKCLAEAFRDALKSLPPRKAQPLIVEFSRVCTSADSSAAADSRVLSRLVNSAIALAVECGHAGILLIIDELGKIFEYAARHPQRGDVFVLQELAELASRSGPRRFLMVGLLHQSFEDYGQHLDATSRKEWQKVHGRFHDVAFLEPPDQLMRMVATAIHWSGFPEIKGLCERLIKIGEAGADAGLCPPGMSRKEFVDLSFRAYPLHPAALVALPWLFRRFAQNERSLFSYLSSFEPSGFQEKIRAIQVDAENPGFIRLHDLFDYFASNFGLGLYRHPNARRWMEAAELLERGKLTTPLEIELVKSVGALNALGEFSHLAAREEMLAYALTDRPRVSAELRQCFDGLRQRSVLAYRRFNHTYRIWEGSDVDIEERLSDGRRQTEGRLRLADILSRYIRTRPFVARRHSFETGALRYFEVIYADDPATLDLSVGRPETKADGKVIVCLAQNEPDLLSFRALASAPQAAEQLGLILAIPTETAELRGAAVELASLRWVWDHTPELRDDRVARRELAQRITDVERALRQQIGGLLDPRPAPVGTSCQWFYRGKAQPVASPAAVSTLISKACDVLYPAVPRIRNEMVNRRALSSQGAGARRLLIELMLTRAAEENLGITGYPQERSFYESTLKATGLHRQGADGSWRIAAPHPNNDSDLRLCPVWEELTRLIFDIEPHPRPLEEIFATLGASPYGLLPGLQPILLCAFLIVHANETTFYREGTFLPEPSLPDWEVLLRRPEMFAIAGCRVQGTRRAVVERLARGFKTLPATVPVVRSLVQNLKRLPEHAHRTQRLATATLKFREVMAQAKSPERLLFVEIPIALDLPPFEETAGIDDARFNDFFARLNGCLQELTNVLPAVVLRARNQLLKECGLAESNAGWLQLVEVAEEVRHFCNSPQLLPFVQRLTDSASAEGGGVEGVLALIANRPPSAWADHDIDRFIEQARHYGGMFRQLAGNRTATPSYRGVLETLTRNEREQSEKLVRRLTEKLNGFRAEAQNPRILEAAFMLLAEKARTEHNQEKTHAEHAHKR